MLNTHKKEILYNVMILIFAFIRISIQMGLPIIGYPSSDVDDMLMVRYGESIAKMQWLGTYNSYTLNKVPGFGIFLGICRILNIPYLLAVIVLYCLGCYLLYIVLCKYTSKGVSFVCYLFILFSPIMFDVKIVQRVYRMSLIPVLVLFTVSSFMGIYFERKNLKKCFPWILCAGFSFSLFYIVREDSVWFLCFVLGATFLLSILTLLDRSIKDIKKKIGIILILCIPIFMCVFTINMIKFINYHYYGLYVTNDFKDTAYADMGKNILRIDGKNKKNIWVTRDTIEKLYKVSPTFAELKAAMDIQYDSEMQTLGALGDDGEIEKDYIMWCIRFAARDSGIYKSAKSADEFYSKVNKEIEVAFKNGKLEENDAIIISNLARPFYLNESKAFLSFLIDQFWKVVCFDGLSSSLNVSDLQSDDFRLVEVVSGNQMIYPDTEIYNISGWMFPADSNKELKIVIHDKEGEVRNIEFKSSQDVFNYFQTSNAKKCRFNIEIDDMKSEFYICSIYLDNKEIYSDYVENLKNININGLYCGIDYCGTYTKTDEKLYFAERNVKIANFIIHLYNRVAPLVFIISIVSFVFMLVICIWGLITKSKIDYSTFVVLIGFLLTILADLFVVSFNYFDAYNRNSCYQYLGGVYPIWQIFVVLSIIYACKYLKNHIKIAHSFKMKGKENTNETNYPNTML